MAKPTSKPVTEIKRRTAAVIQQLREDRVPVLITERGRSAAVLLDVETYEGMVLRLQVVEGIARGERALEEGHAVSHTRAKKQLSRWLLLKIVWAQRALGDLDEIAAFIAGVTAAARGGGRWTRGCSGGSALLLLGFG